MSKHTRGPWKQHLVDETLIVDSRGNEVAQATGDYLTDYERVEKDARLIAAAPELLEALQAAVNCGMVPVSSVKEGGANKHSEQVRVADMIRAAIAKATGGKP